MDQWQLPIELVDSEGGTAAPLPSLIPVVIPPEELAPPVPAVPIINYDIVPSLRGKAVRDPTLGPAGKNIAIRGKWAMIDTHHGQEGMSSDFELTQLETFTPANILVLQGADAGEFKDSALSGKYAGWFRLKRATGTGTDQVPERDVILSFSMRPQGGFEISGEGANKYGDYVLKGHMNADQTVVMYRQYVIKVGGAPPEASPRNKKGSKNKSLTHVKSDTAAKASRNVKAEVVLPLGPQRDGAGRDRKKTAVMAEAYAVGAPAPAKALPPPPPLAPAAESAAAAQRSQRVGQHLLRCEALLKEMIKMKQAFFFLEPVDPVKLGIPEYYDVVPNPMDFGTVRSKLQGNEYASPADFAADIRLVFRNAITFNQMRDNPVHMAARELSTKFEERFRLLTMQLSNPGIVTNPQELAALHQKASRPVSKPKPKTARKPAVGANLGLYGRGGVAAAPDGSMVAFAEMQRMMQNMQQELNGLRQQTNQQNVVAELDAQQWEAQNPLTYVEKKTLIGEIHKLPQEHMEEVIRIVTAAKPDTGDDEEIEIPLDELDTSTMRQLQRYVASLKKPKQEAHRPAVKAAPALKRMKSDPASFSEFHAPVLQQQDSSSSAPAAGAGGGGGGGFGARRPLPAEQVQSSSQDNDALPMFQDQVQSQPTTAAEAPEAEAPSSHMEGAFGEIDFSAMSGMMEMGEEGPEMAAQANAAAWGAPASAAAPAAASSSSCESALSDRGSDTWGAAGNELLEKQQREQQLKAQERVVEQQRKATEAASVAAFAETAAKEADAQRAAEALAAAVSQRAAAEAAAQREQERQHRESMGATIQGDNADLARHITGVTAQGPGPATTWL